MEPTIVGQTIIGRLVGMLLLGIGRFLLALVKIRIGEHARTEQVEN